MKDDMKEQILAKILNPDGSLVWKYSKPTLIQKYLTQEEIEYLNTCYGDTLSEKYYCLKNNLPNGKQCPVCHKKLTFNSFKEGYHNYCSYSCRSKAAVFTDESKEKRRNTNLQKYGTSCSLNANDSKEKRMQTNLEKYGSISPFGSDQVKEKISNIINDKYGSRSNLMKQVAQNHENGYGFGNQEVADRCKQTMLDRYGVDNYKKTAAERQAQSERSKEIIKKSIDIQKKKYGTIWLNTPEGQRLNRTPKYIYKNEKFDSSWELYYWLWCLGNNIPIERNYKYFTYMLNGKVKRYYPDFIINSNQFVELKGDHLINDVYHNSTWQEKAKICKRENIIVLSLEDMKPIIKFVQDKYGKTFVSQFKQKSANSFKRKIVEFTSLQNIYQYRNDNIRFHYKCRRCQRDVYTTYFLIDHFNDRMCKHCRKITN